MLVILSKKDVVIGHTIEAIKHAYENNCNFILNSELKYHSYEEEEKLASDILWKMSMTGQCFFNTPPIAIEINDNLIVHHPRVKTKIACENVHIYSAAGISCSQVHQEIEHYRVLDWFDVYGDSQLLAQKYEGWENVKSIISFASKRIDQKNEKKDLLVEQLLTQQQLHAEEHSDTTIRHRLVKLMQEKGLSLEMNLWKRDVYPIEKQFYHVLKLNPEV